VAVVLAFRLAFCGLVKGGPALLIAALEAKEFLVVDVRGAGVGHQIDADHGLSGEVDVPSFGGQDLDGRRRARHHAATNPRVLPFRDGTDVEQDFHEVVSAQTVTAVKEVTRRDTEVSLEVG